MSITIALAGNPNCGKTTLFNALTGANQYVGNWPGVTVEKKEGKYKGNKEVLIQDLPGIYSLSPYTLEEVVSREYLVTQKPDAILNIVDGTNIERNLYLTTQLLELGIPVVVAVNMIDLVRKNGDTINIEALSKGLSCPVIEISALKGEGNSDAIELAVKAAKEHKLVNTDGWFDDSVEETLSKIKAVIKGIVPEELERWYTVKVFERDSKVIESISLGNKTGDIESLIEACETAHDDDAESIITNQRYNYIGRITSGAIKKAKTKDDMTTSDKIDKLVTNRILGLPIFVAVMYLVYAISMGDWRISIGTKATDFTNDVIFGEWVPGWISSLLGHLGISEGGWLFGLINDGIVAGVGAVLGFVPQMLVLFLFLAILEDIGYMSRVAFVMDRIFRHFGLSGKSFIPCMVATGCGVPGIMASRTIEQDRDRKLTVMTTTFMPCGAKLPIIGLIAGAIFGGSPWIAVSAYFIGMAAIVISGIILKKTTMFAGEPAPFVMEMPPYHIPTLGTVLRSTWERGWSFIRKAGTIILLSTIFVWFTSFFGFTEDGFRMLSEEELNLSILAKIGNLVAWIFIPLGWGNWQAAVASITGLVAKENIVGTMGILYGTGGNVWDTLGSVFNGVTGYSFLVFNLLCAPCFAAIGAIKREMNNTKWTWFAIGYQCGFAYVVAMMIHQFGSAYMGETHIIGLIASVICLATMIYMLFRPYKEATHHTEK